MKDKDYPSAEQPANIVKEDMDALFEKQNIERLREAILLSFMMEVLEGRVDARERGAIFTEALGRLAKIRFPPWVAALMEFPPCALCVIKRKLAAFRRVSVFGLRRICNLKPHILWTTARTLFAA